MRQSLRFAVMDDASIHGVSGQPGTQMAAWRAGAARRQTTVRSASRSVLRPPTANATLSTTGGCRKASPARPNGRASPKNPQLIQLLSTAKLPRFPTLSTKLSTGQDWRPWRSSPLPAARFPASGTGQELSGGVSCAWTGHSPASHAMEGRSSSARRHGPHRRSPRADRSDR